MRWLEELYAGGKFRITCFWHSDEILDGFRLAEFTVEGETRSEVVKIASAIFHERIDRRRDSIVIQQQEILDYARMRKEITKEVTNAPMFTCGACGKSLDPARDLGESDGVSRWALINPCHAGAEVYGPLELHDGKYERMPMSYADIEFDDSGDDYIP